MQLVRTTALSWAAAATDPPKLRSLLLFSDNPAYKHCSLYGYQDLYAVSHELGEQAGRQYARVTVYGHAENTTAQHYQHAAKEILGLTHTDSLKGSAIPQAAVEPLTEVAEQHGWRRTYCQPCHQFTCSPAVTEPAAVSAAVDSLSSSYVLSELTLEDAAVVDSLWTFRSAGSLSLIQGLISCSHTTCIRLKDGTPVAWMLEVEPLCGGMLHVVDEHRRNKLARVVCLDLFSKLQKKWQHLQQQQDVAAVVGDPTGHGVYAYVVEDNTASMRLMQALKLHYTGIFTWIGFDRVS